MKINKQNMTTRRQIAGIGKGTGVIMKYEELIEIVREGTKNTKVSRTVGHAAFQFNVKGEAEGAFYVEIYDGRVYVEPYEYYDRDLIIVTTADVILQLLKGTLHPKAAYTDGLMELHGDVRRLDVLPFGSNN